MGVSLELLMTSLFFCIAFGRMRKQASLCLSFKNGRTPCTAKVMNGLMPLMMPSAWNKKELRESLNKNDSQ